MLVTCPRGKEEKQIQSLYWHCKIQVRRAFNPRAISNSILESPPRSTSHLYQVGPPISICRSTHGGTRYGRSTCAVSATNGSNAPTVLRLSHSGLCNEVEDVWIQDRRHPPKGTALRWPGCRDSRLAWLMRWSRSIDMQGYNTPENDDDLLLAHTCQ